MWSKKFNLEINFVFHLSPGYTDKVWELLREILPEFKLSAESSSESKITDIDAKFVCSLEEKL